MTDRNTGFHQNHFPLQKPNNLKTTSLLQTKSLLHVGNQTNILKRCRSIHTSDTDSSPFIIRKHVEESWLGLCSENEEELTSSSLREKLSNGSRPEVRRGYLQRIISIEEDHLPHLLHCDYPTQTPLQTCAEGEETADNEGNMDLEMSDIYPGVSSPQQQQQQSKRHEAPRGTPTSPRGQPVGKETGMNVSEPWIRPTLGLAIDKTKQPARRELIPPMIYSRAVCSSQSLTFILQHVGGRSSIAAWPPLQDCPGGELQRGKDFSPSPHLWRLLPSWYFCHCRYVWLASQVDIYRRNHRRTSFEKKTFSFFLFFR